MSLWRKEIGVREVDERPVDTLIPGIRFGSSKDVVVLPVLQGAGSGFCVIADIFAEMGRDVPARQE